MCIKDPPLVTVIIATHNDEQDIENAVRSARRQTWRELEIIVVDDGSTDSTGAKCDAIAARDSRVRVIHMKNSGVSAARNTALESMRGEYVTFLDGDDLLSPKAVEAMMAGISDHDADIATCALTKERSDGSSFKNFVWPDGQTQVTEGISSVVEMLYATNCNTSVCQKLFKRALFDGKYAFPTDIRMGEDSYFTYRCFLDARRVAHVPEMGYIYRFNRESVTNKAENNLKFYDYVRVYDRIVEEGFASDDPAYVSAVLTKLVGQNFWAMMKLRADGLDHEKELDHIRRNIRRYRARVIMNPRAETHVRGACALSYAGFGTVNVIYDRHLFPAK
ncbi:MAG: glycosyltransferase [Clostridia bacterium]|nr:glycosyltransferase [Clostridia bacterium]